MIQAIVFDVKFAFVSAGKFVSLTKKTEAAEDIFEEWGSNVLYPRNGAAKCFIDIHLSALVGEESKQKMISSDDLHGKLTGIS